MAPFIVTLFVPLLPVWPLVLSLNLNESIVLLVKSTVTPVLSKVGSSLQYLC